jgi:uncharacterized protein YvpB
MKKIGIIILVLIVLFLVADYLFSDKPPYNEIPQYRDVETQIVATTTTETSASTTSVATSSSKTLAKTSVTPKLDVLKLDVPYHHQQFVNSCEAASLSMALGYYGVHIGDMAVVNAFGYDPKLKDVPNNIWDDPQKMFVGFVDLASSTGGYGTYGRPVVKAAEAYGRTAIYKTSITPAELAAEIKAGHPVVMWGYTSLTQAPYTWNLVDGGTVKAFHGEHARLVVGVLGDISNPAGFYVHDPMVGAYQYWSSTLLMKQFNSVPGVTNQVVIVK